MQRFCEAPFLFVFPLTLTYNNDMKAEKPDTPEITPEQSKALVPAKNHLPIPGDQSPAKSLEAYIHFANSVPMLSAEEERELAERLRQKNDIEAAQKLILSHLRFVIKIARSLSGYGLAMSDLIQEGNIGLMKAVKRFNPTIGVRLVTFAVHWIKAEMHDFIIRNWRVVKIATTKSQRKLFFNLRSSKERLGWFSEEEIQEVAKTLNVKPSEVIEMERRMNAYDMAFDAPDESGDEPQAFSPEHFLTSSELTPEQAAVEDQLEINQQEALERALEQLSDRDLDIIKSRWLTDKKATLHELADKYNISAERVRQVEANALKLLKREMDK